MKGASSTRCDRHQRAPLQSRELTSRGHAPCLWRLPLHRAAALHCRCKPQQQQVVRESFSSQDDLELVPPFLATKKSQDDMERELVNVERVLQKEQRGESLAAWVGLATAFGAGVWYLQGAEKGQEYFAGYLLEQSLSVDNLFVFILVFNYFKTPEQSQQKVLTWGILTAAVLRLVLIVMGIELIDNFRPLLFVFAGILIFSAAQLLREGGEDEEEDLHDNAVVKVCRQLIQVTDKYDGDKFFTYENGARIATPLLLTLAVVEVSDVVFAVDSIPAVFGVTLDPFIVYTSNIFAILSLRALYSFVASSMSELKYLDKAVAVVLGFIGLKMIGEFVDINIPTYASLLFVAAVLGGGVGASLLSADKDRADSKNN